LIIGVVVDDYYMPNPRRDIPDDFSYSIFFIEGRDKDVDDLIGGVRGWFGGWGHVFGD
jgi:hypothetical protein